MNAQALRDLAYLVAAALFIFDLKWMAHPRTAVRGNIAGAVGMAIAILATVLGQPMTWHYILIGAGVGTLTGALMATRVKMTSMPEMVGLLNGFGGGASILVAGSALIAVYQALTSATPMGMQEKVATVASALIGSVTFFGSYVAFGKLAEFLAVKWKLKPWQSAIKYGFSAITALGGLAYALNVGVFDAGATVRDRLIAWLAFAAFAAAAGLLLIKKDRFAGINALKWASAVASLALGAWLVVDPANIPLYWLLTGVAAILGVLLTISIGGADMPVAIALLNSYSGLAGCATGFVINNSVLIVAGSLVGASGIILTQIMCKAMNRSMANVLFSTLGPTSETPSADETYKKVKATSAEEIAMMLDGAQRVVIVPGYGMAVSQAQHTVRQLAHLLEEKGARVEYAVHPVAGRMPGHMNVLLAEANVEYEKLREMDDINGEMDQVDVAIVIGANDVVNPVAETDPKSAIAGMPIIQAHKAHTVIVIKRSLSPGFAGIPNPLFAADNSLMFFSDGKKAIQDIINAVKEAA
ncbi:MAG: NAD(P)(+) transhydrogenase (Re/Si-specific) subunit beta [Thermoanaerobaculia bacterium]|nr:MAG: NAD(P)(+) transhydrogenase (Re/Si-specific) subunit beta [Thermoanaerobaculia bacterium]